MEALSHLPRLVPGFYRGRSFIHWSLCIKDRQTGWLAPAFHFRFREILLHTCARYSFVCPVYCLMPDHIHLLMAGVRAESDQQQTLRHLKRYLGPLLAPFKFQKQSYDHVLREDDLEHEAFSKVRYYLLENPVRAGLCRTAGDWPYSGCMVPGYPDLSPLRKGYWDLFWRLYDYATHAASRHGA